MAQVSFHGMGHAPFAHASYAECVNHVPGLFCKPCPRSVPVHEIENLFLAPGILHATLKYLGRIEEAATVDELNDQLREVARSLREWIAADWVAWDITHSIQLPSRRIGGCDPKRSLERYVANLRDRLADQKDAGAIDRRVEAKLGEIDRLLESDEWRKRLPGKQILNRFLERYPSLGPELYVDAAVGTIIKESITVPDLERLKDVLHDAAAT